MIDIIDDISTLTTIPKSNLDKLVEQSIKCISHSVWENNEETDYTVDLNIGIGTLHIKVESNTVKYKFIPSSKLEKSIQSALLDNIDPLVCVIEQAVCKKILTGYKEFFH